MTDNKSMFLAQYGDKDHIDDIINKSTNPVLKKSATKNICISDETMNKMVNSSNTTDRQNIAKNPNLSKSNIDKLVNDDSMFVRSAISDNPNLHKDHIDKLVNDDSASNISDIAHHPKLSLEQAKIGYKNLKDRNKNILVNRFKSNVKEIHGYDV